MFHPGVWASFGGMILAMMLLLCVARNFKLWAYKRLQDNADELVTKSDLSSFWDIVTMVLYTPMGRFCHSS